VSTPLRVVGVGNAARGDDAAGLLVARRLRDLAPDADVHEQTGEPLALLECLSGADAAVVVDALAPAGSPGRILRVDTLADLAPACRSSTHGGGVREALELCRALGRLPAVVTVYGIEAGDVTLGAGVSREVVDAAERLARDLARMLARPAA